MGNKIFKQITKEHPDDILVKDEDTLSILSDLDNIIEPKVVVEQNIIPICAKACETVTIDIPVIVNSDVAEFLSKSLPIDIPIHEDVLDHKSELMETMNERIIIENNNSEENASLSSISEECGLKTEPVTEESELSSDEDVLELDE